MDKNLEKLIQKRVELLYAKSHSSSIMERLKSQIAFYKNKIDAFKHNKSRAMTEKDVVLITYADQVSTKNEMPLKTLGSFLKKYCINSINSVHILPFFPYSSDDGFSVVDYKKVNPDVGDWSDIEELRKDFHLMFDAVINHISAKSDWFKEFLAGNPKYKDFFITCDPSEDLSEVTRPRSLPLLTKFDTSEGEKWVWTTFSEDQVDLNFDSPELALAVMDILLFYASKGASIIRFDAIAYIWKKVGTNCIHLKEVHEFVKLMKNVFDAVAPHVTIITETNVPHKENISYFGENGDEAQMIYQFTLPPLTAHAILRQDSVAIREWARTLEHPGYGNTYFNFTASHDGVGLRPASGIISDDEIDFLA
ncbi:MAG: alpha-amylase family glycosyl hydrolase, partial [Verrucomicrobiota bacterium]|nr:alpha-amylase family glycosyl hydrolase [Verrucomicrobiota bacterium]